MEFMLASQILGGGGGALPLPPVSTPMAYLDCRVQLFLPNSFPVNVTIFRLAS